MMYFIEKNRLLVPLMAIIFITTVFILVEAIQHHFHSSAVRNSALENANIKIDERNNVFNLHLNNLSNTILALRKNKNFEAYLQTNQTSDELTNDFKLIANSYNNIMQLRLLDKNGLELIRVERDSAINNVIIVNKENLQNKSNRYYFYESKTKPLGKPWFSNLDLNVEHGKVQKPFTPVIRVILPIAKENHFNGVIVINIFMKEFLDYLMNTPTYDSILVNEKGDILSHYNNQYNWSAYTNKKDVFKKEFEDYDKILKHTLYNGKTYLSKKLDLPFAEDLFLILKVKQEHIDAEIENYNHGLVYLFILFICSIVLALFLLYKLFKGVLEEKTLLNENLKTANKELEKLFNQQDNIVIVTNGKELKFANNKFFNFLPFNNLENFKELHSSISECFIEKEDFFYIGKDIHNNNWIKAIQNLSQNERVVAMLGKDFNVHAFSMNINKFEDDEYIVSFTDISETMLEQVSLKRKTIHDTLTNAYNREYFAINSERIINEYTQNDSLFGMALLDIDFFKKINDQHGHDIGDEVLKYFVKTINKFSRQDDILIRWGGEEFILLLKVNSLKGFKKALEHLREEIENKEFPTVKHLTCSIGGTLYEADEDIERTIKRADEALYNAKDSGRNMVIIK